VLLSLNSVLREGGWERRVRVLRVEAGSVVNRSWDGSLSEELDERSAAGSLENSCGVHSECVRVSFEGLVR
jgi:hypothetical protein